MHINEVVFCSVSNSIRKVTDDISSDIYTYCSNRFYLFSQSKIVLLDCKHVTAYISQGPDMDAANSIILPIQKHVYHSIM
jgi:hypothetical protein